MNDIQVKINSLKIVRESDDKDAESSTVVQIEEGCYGQHLKVTKSGWGNGEILINGYEWEKLSKVIDDLINDIKKSK